MLRFLLFTMLTLSTFMLGLWSYKINYDSRAADERVKELEKSILSTSKEHRNRLFFLFLGSHLPNPKPTRGTPTDDPQPKILNL